MDEPTGQCSNCLQWHETDDCPCDTPEERMIDSLHDELRAERNETAALRTRLESTEAARRDAQESRFALIVQNEELGAELAATRARLESAEAAMRECDAILARAQAGEIAHPDPEQWPENIRFWKAVEQARKRVAAALGAAGEESEG